MMYLFFILFDLASNHIYVLANIKLQQSGSQVWIKDRYFWLYDENDINSDKNDEDNQ